MNTPGGARNTPGGARNTPGGARNTPDNARNTPDNARSEGARLGVAFASGLVFAVGLGISGMGQPAKVLAFLDVAGAWDPSLLLVMGGAIAVHFGFAQRAKRSVAPVLAPSFALPPSGTLTKSLFAGSALFGVGWGLAGYCPGPAVLAIASGNAVPLTFVAAMLAGMLLHRAFIRSPDRAAVTASVAPRRDV